MIILPCNVKSKKNNLTATSCKTYLKGCDLQKTYSWVLNIHFVSYVNKLTISLAVDATVIPDPHRLCDDLVESLNIIKSTALEKFRIS
ncbi:hypothetical protein YC2023_056010 [Brassica napus]